MPTAQELAAQFNFSDGSTVHHVRNGDLTAAVRPCIVPGRFSLAFSNGQDDATTARNLSLDDALAQLVAFFQGEPLPPRGPALHLVACVAGKLDRIAPAKDLYVSDWFRKARAYVEAIGAPWAILSAEHGLVSPDAVLPPYDATLADMDKRRRQFWGAWVADSIQNFLEWPRNDVVFLAGRNYREPIMDADIWKARKHSATVPMAGLGIGEQKAWLARHAAAAQVAA